MNNYPEHEKFEYFEDESGIIEEFLLWLFTEGHYICNLNDNGRMAVWEKSISELVALYFDIDLRKMSQEKDQMLDDWRESQGL